MYIINSNNEVYEIKDSSLVRSFTNLRPDGELLVISSRENRIRLRELYEKIYSLYYSSDLIKTGQENCEKVVDSYKKH